MKLWGQEYSQRQLEGFTSDLRSIADIRLMTLDDGQERGTRVAEIRTGSGFDCMVLLDRAMDIGTATYNGIPLAWQSGTGAAHPSRYEPEGLGWLRTFHGGLLALCGLTHAGFGNPPVDPQNNERLGLHGRIGTIPAYDVRIERGWQDDQWLMRLHGTVDEVVLFGYRLRLERTIEFTVGEPEIRIYDRVRNVGGFESPLMILYHCNFGWPVVSPDSVIKSPAKRVEPRDAVAEPGLNNWHQMNEPVPAYKEQVFWHYIESKESNVSASIFNQKLNLGVRMDFDPRGLPYMTEWKQMGFGDYVVGLEPGNCFPIGRVASREAGALRMLPPGETDQFYLSFRVITSQ
jgi:hypothetical protein